MLVAGDNVLELWPPAFLLFTTQVIYEYEEPQLNDIKMGKPNNSERNLSLCHFGHYKYHMD
jgi:hypothetical protein